MADAVDKHSEDAATEKVPFEQFVKILDDSVACSQQYVYTPLVEALRFNQHAKEGETAVACAALIDSMIEEATPDSLVIKGSDALMWAIHLDEPGYAKKIAAKMNPEDFGFKNEKGLTALYQASNQLRRARSRGIAKDKSYFEPKSMEVQAEWISLIETILNCMQTELLIAEIKNTGNQVLPLEIAIKHGIAVPSVVGRLKSETTFFDSDTAVIECLARVFAFGGGYTDDLKYLIDEATEEAMTEWHASYDPILGLLIERQYFATAQSLLAKMTDEVLGGCHGLEGISLGRQYTNLKKMAMESENDASSLIEVFADALFERLKPKDFRDAWGEDGKTPLMHAIESDISDVERVLEKLDPSDLAIKSIKPPRFTPLRYNYPLYLRDRSGCFTEPRTALEVALIVCKPALAISIIKKMHTIDLRAVVDEVSDLDQCMLLLSQQDCASVKAKIGEKLALIDAASSEEAFLPGATSDGANVPAGKPSGNDTWAQQGYKALGGLGFGAAVAGIALGATLTIPVVGAVVMVVVGLVIIGVAIFKRQGGRFTGLLGFKGAGKTQGSGGCYPHIPSAGLNKSSAVAPPTSSTTGGADRENVVTHESRFGAL